ALGAAVARGGDGPARWGAPGRPFAGEVCLRRALWDSHRDEFGALERGRPCADLEEQALAEHIAGHGDGEGGLAGVVGEGGALTEAVVLRRREVVDRYGPVVYGSALLAAHGDDHAELSGRADALGREPDRGDLELARIDRLEDRCPRRCPACARGGRSRP